MRSRRQLLLRNYPSQRILTKAPVSLYKQGSLFRKKKKSEGKMVKGMFSNNVTGLSTRQLFNDVF